MRVQFRLSRMHRLPMALGLAAVLTVAVAAAGEDAAPAQQPPQPHSGLWSSSASQASKIAACAGQYCSSRSSHQLTYLV